MDIVITTSDPDAIHLDEMRTTLEKDLDYFVASITVKDRSGVEVKRAVYRD